MPLKIVKDGLMDGTVKNYCKTTDQNGLCFRFLKLVKTSVINSFVQGTKADFYNVKRNQDLRFKMY